MEKSEKPYTRILQVPEENLHDVMEVLGGIPRKNVYTTIQHSGSYCIIKAKLKRQEMLLLKLRFPIGMVKPNRKVPPWVKWRK